MADTLAPAAVAAPAARPRMSAWQQAALSLYWLGTSAHWTAIVITLLPLQAERIGGAELKGVTLGNILAVSAFVSMVVAPLLGAWSDRLRTPWGRRQPAPRHGWKQSSSPTSSRMMEIAALKEYAEKIQPRLPMPRFRTNVILSRRSSSRSSSPLRATRKWCTCYGAATNSARR